MVVIWIDFVYQYNNKPLLLMLNFLKKFQSLKVWLLVALFLNHIVICLFISHAAATAAKLLQLCPSLRDPIDSSPPGSAIPEILQARTVEWAAIFFSNAGK